MEDSRVGKRGPLTPAYRLISFGLALATSAVVAGLVVRGHASHRLTAAWAAAVLLFALATLFVRRGRSFRLLSVAPLLFAAALPVVVRVVGQPPDRMHADEFLTAYFSATHDFAQSSFFGYMPEKWEWQGQFPKPFFFLQRLFFGLFGESTTSVRLSVQPYVAIVSVMLFLTVRELTDTIGGLVAVVLYSFFAPSVYLESLGFFFISSTAFFSVFFYFGLRELRTGELFAAAMTGVACGFCYLTYPSSYLAFPLLLASFAVHWVRERKLRVIQNLSIALGGMFVVLAPFAAFLLRSGDYASRRVADTSLLWGHLSPFREAIAKGETTAAAVLRDNLGRVLTFFAKDDVGGGGGFEFARFSMLDRFSLVLVAAGLVVALVRAPRRPEYFLVLLALAGSIGMVVVIMPPPTVHRLSIAFPLLVILMTLPIALLLRLPKPAPRVRAAMAVGIVAVFVAVNQRRFAEAVFRDPTGDDFRLSELLNQRYGGRSLYVAAFPAFGFQKIFHFRDRWPDRHVETDFHADLLKRLDPREKYVYVITLADHFRERFHEADPNGRFSRFSIGYSIFAN